ncbi:hypothetical protein NPIL_8171, partial [Nephila pilipes]
MSKSASETAYSEPPKRQLRTIPENGGETIDMHTTYR